VTELSEDTRDRLVGCLSSAADRARERDAAAVEELLGTVRTVTENEVPAGGLRDRLDHGRTTAARLVADEPLVAAEYLDAMCRLVEDAG